MTDETATTTIAPGPPPRARHLSYANRLESRDIRDIDLVVIHCTELPDLSEARRYSERIHYAAERTGNSGHYYIDRDGLTEQWVPPDRIAHHVRGHDGHSVGIELVNTGRFPDWFHSEAQDRFEPYPDEQIDALVRLVVLLCWQLPSLATIAGHEDLDTELAVASDNQALRVPRKRDPGPTFPWDRVLADCGLPRIP